MKENRKLKVNKNINKKLNNKINNKRGAELVENILMIGIAIALIVVIFYPQIMELMNIAFSSLETWFQSALGKIGQPV